MLMPIDTKKDNLILNQIDSLKIGESCVLENVYFEFDKSNLREASFALLNQLSEYLKNHQNVKLLIIGYTDNIGTVLHNKDKKDLSCNRAKSIVNFLVSQGVSMDRLQFEGKGANEPIEKNETESGRQKNRRVEIKLIEK